MIWLVNMAGGGKYQKLDDDDAADVGSFAPSESVTENAAYVDSSRGTTQEEEEEEDSKNGWS